MKLYLDSANIDEIREINSLGIISGVTTNPSLLAREGEKDLKSVIDEISSIVNGHISAEVISLDYEGMVKEARELSALNKNVVVKIPMTYNGLKAVRRLKSEGIRTNMTLIFSANQALLAARAGASYVSPFVGRMDDLGNDGVYLVSEIVEIFEIHGIETEIIAASVRSPMHVSQLAKVGSDIATVPFVVFEAMISHPMTDIGIDMFMSDWEENID